MSSTSLSIKKYALLIERPGGPLSGVSAAVEALGYQVTRASAPRAAVELVASSRRLSIVIVNGDTVGTDARWLIVSIKDQQPDLPILWFTSDPKRAASLPNKIELLTADAAEIEARLVSIASKDLYSQPFVGQIVSGIQAVLREFRVVEQLFDVCVKASLTNLSEVTALITFSGTGAAGHLVLTSSSGDLTQPHRTKFPHTQFPGQDDLEDFLGEIGNQIVGVVKRTIELDGAECRIGLPHFIRGVDGRFRHKAGVSSLGLAFGDGGARFTVELCMHRLDRSPVAGGGSKNQMKAGIVNLL